MTREPSPGRAAIEADQLEKLNRLIRQQAESNPFYKERLVSAGISQGVTSLAEFSEKMPFTRKQELVADQIANPPYGTNLAFPVSHYTRYSQTSATTGTPMRWLDTPESWEWMQGNWRRVFAEAGIGSGDRIFFAFSYGPFLGFWTAFDAATRIGCLCIPGGGMNSATRLRILLDNEATVLCCTPTYAIHLQEVALQEGIDLGRSAIRKIVVAGEPGGSIAATRVRISEAWGGAKVFDHHGMTEVGPVSFQTANHPGVLHLIESSYLAEVIDPDIGSPSRPGETGELVLTTLGRIGSPLIRYRTGDLVRPVWDGEETYGVPEVALIGGILGRSDDMVVIRGVNVSPAAVEDVIRSFDNLGEYRVEIRREQGLAQIKVLAEPLHPTADRQLLARHLESAFRLTFNLRVPVEIVDRGSLPRFEMKAKRWVKLLPGSSHA